MNKKMLKAYIKKLRKIEAPELKKEGFKYEYDWLKAKEIERKYFETFPERKEEVAVMHIKHTHISPVRIARVVRIPKEAIDSGIIKPRLELARAFTEDIADYIDIKLYERYPFSPSLEMLEIRGELQLLPIPKDYTREEV